MFTDIRRKDRILENELAYRLLESGEYGFLAMEGVNGYGYGIPISYVLNDDKCIYFHCAPEGYKLECLKQNPKVSFSVVGETRVIPGQFTTAYESAIAFGTIHMDLPVEERMLALRLLAKKYCSGFEVVGEKYIAGSFKRTNVLRLDIEHISGKCKRIK
ncbi:MULTISPECIES: pyridoxamine 5'-phosphate oxidase family protein [Parabacteroides]|jgi:5-nitroimidazole antibiotic resistance protein|uniref:pyridoxamine 5'-phosphate oxidase family protein n=1 Tax=Parabacteroides TaxID=375288 RepID=UPI000EFE1CA8|nr:pyridoxamine 5'-phosphate oxidase family protein [Parabacteroides sp. AF18-52]RHR40890.1 pyridoxamine 5'-phosphate oxidase family protein [Parabacteroides sp. AF18-52]